MVVDFSLFPISFWLVLASCATMALFAWAMVLVWFASGDLERWTVIAVTILTFLLLGLAIWSWFGGVWWALGCLIGLFLLLVTADVVSFGAATVSSNGFVLPIVLAGMGFGWWAGLGVALACSVVLCGTAVAGYKGWHEPRLPFVESHLTFNAPVQSGIFLFVAILVGS